MDGWLGITKRENPPDQYLYKFACSKPNCRYSVVCFDITDAESVSSLHVCPWMGGESKRGMMVGKTLLEKVWAELDDVVTELRRDSKSSPDAVLKAKAEAYATVLALFMSPIFTTVPEISAEAGRRYRARVNNDDEYCTPGMGKRRLEMPRGTSAPRATSKPKVTTKLSKSDQASIKEYAAMGGIALENLAKLYSVPLEEITAIVAS